MFRWYFNDDVPIFKRQIAEVTLIFHWDFSVVLPTPKRTFCRNFVDILCQFMFTTFSMDPCFFCFFQFVVLPSQPPKYMYNAPKRLKLLRGFMYFIPYSQFEEMRFDKSIFSSFFKCWETGMSGFLMEYLLDIPQIMGFFLQQYWSKICAQRHGVSFRAECRLPYHEINLSPSSVVQR